MKNQPLVSVIIPTYNRGNIISRSIKSILNQSYKNIELIVVDDASDDNTREIISTIRDDRLIYVKNKKNLGVAGSRNTGVDISHGEYIAFNDSDDIWLEDKLEKQMKVFREHDDCELCYCAYILKHQDEITQVPKKNLDENILNGRIYEHLLRENWIGTPTIVLSRSAFLSVGGFNNKLRALDDWDLVIKISRLYKVRFLNEVLVHAGYSQDGITYDEGNFFYHVQAIIEIIKENIKWNRDTDYLDTIYEMLIQCLIKLSEDELKECKKEAVPYIFNNGFVFDKIVEEQKAISNIHKSVLRYKEKYTVLYKLYDKCSCLNKLSLYVIDNNIQTTAIYGYGDIGKILLDYLEELDIKVEYIVDKNSSLDTPYPLIDPNDELPRVDLLIVTIIDNEFKITDRMKAKLDGHVLRLQDLL